MDQTIQVYIKKDDCYLLLYRNKKKNDMSEGKWLAPGGHIEVGESSEQAAIRETREETGLTINSLRCAGEVLFVNDDYEEMMYIYITDDFSGEVIECNEGDLKWIPIKDMYNLPMWEGDKAYLPLLEKDSPYFKMKIRYSHKDLVDVSTY